MKNLINKLTRIPNIVWILIAVTALDVIRRVFLGNGCGIKQLFGFACPACGMSRAYISLLMLDFKSAFYYNPAFITYPVALFACVMMLISKKRRWLWLTLFILSVTALLAVWIFRLATGTTV